MKRLPRPNHDSANAQSHQQVDVMVRGRGAFNEGVTLPWREDKPWLTPEGEKEDK